MYQYGNGLIMVQDWGENLSEKDITFKISKYDFVNKNISHLLWYLIEKKEKILSEVDPPKS